MTPPTSPIPVRVDPRPYTGVRPPELGTVESVIADIQTAPARIPAETFERWMSDPDERVLVELAGAQRVVVAGESPAATHLRVLSRALREAEAEGLIWTPLLDAYTHRRQWPTVETLQAAGFSAADAARPRVRLARLAPFLPSASPDDLVPLTRLKITAVHRLIALHASTITDELLEGLLAPGTDLVMTVLQRGGSLDAGTKSALGRHAERMVRQPTEATDEGRHQSQILVKLVSGLLAHGWTMPTPMAQAVRTEFVTLGTARAHSDALDEDRVRALHLQSGRTGGRGLQGTDAGLSERAEVLLMLLLTPGVVEHTGMDTETLARWVWAAPNGLLLVARHGTLSTETRLRMVATRRGGLWAALAARADVGADEIVARALVETNDPHVAVLLAPHVSPLLFREIVDRFIGRRPTIALEILRHATSLQRSVVDPEALLPLLSNKDLDIREGALMTLPALGPDAGRTRVPDEVPAADETERLRRMSRDLRARSL